MTFPRLAPALDCEPRHFDFAGGEHSANSDPLQGWQLRASARPAPAARRRFADHVGPHAFDVLTVLASESGRLVPKDELLRRVWARVVVEENTLQAHISAPRKVLGRDAIATVWGRGYRFALEVTSFRHP